LERLSLPLLTAVNSRIHATTAEKAKLFDQTTIALFDLKRHQDVLSDEPARFVKAVHPHAIDFPLPIDQHAPHAAQQFGVGVRNPG
jgi:hypothetical protein